MDLKLKVRTNRFDDQQGFVTLSDNYLLHPFADVHISPNDAAKGCGPKLR